MKEKSNNAKGEFSTEEKLQNAIDELSLQNEIMERRVEELTIVNKELAYLNTEQQTLFASIVNSSDDAMPVSYTHLTLPTICSV